MGPNVTLTLYQSQDKLWLFSVSPACSEGCSFLGHRKDSTRKLALLLAPLTSDAGLIVSLQPILSLNKNRKQDAWN